MSNKLKAESTERNPMQSIESNSFVEGNQIFWSNPIKSVKFNRDFQIQLLNPIESVEIYCDSNGFRLEYPWQHKNT